MDRYWESNDGFAVSSRQIRTAWGTVEHVAINRMNGNSRDVPWAIKQQIINQTVEECILLYTIRKIKSQDLPFSESIVDGNGRITLDYLGSRLCSDDDISFMCIHKTDVYQICFF